MRILLLMLVLIPSLSRSESIDNYYYYQLNKGGARNPKYTHAVYLRKDDPCIFLEDLDKKEKFRFCELGDSGLNLSTDYPTIWATDFHLISGNVFSFIVAAPWNEQQCEINIIKSQITCKSTGK